MLITCPRALRSEQKAQDDAFNIQQFLQEEAGENIRKHDKVHFMPRFTESGLCRAASNGERLFCVMDGNTETYFLSIADSFMNYFFPNLMSLW